MAKSLKKFRIWLLAFIMIAAQLGFIVPVSNVAKAADNGLAQKPYMGWSSYSMQVYSGNGHWITAAQIKAQSDAMHEKLQSHGYEYINIDAAWNGGMDGYGRPIPSTTLYPNGFQEVIDHVHNNGQKIGIYGIPGLSPQAYADDLPIYGAPGCSMKDIAAQPLAQSDYWGFGYKIDFSNPCSQSYIDSIANLYGEWGIDFLKFDSVTPGSGISDLSLDARDDVAAWSKALKPHGIWLELSWALDIKYIDTWKKYANGWRVDWDVECYCGTNGLTKWENIARLFPIAAQWWRHAGPGGWNDFDSLNIGNGAMDGITPEERRTAMTFWSISSAQLYTGNDLTNLDSYGLELLTNDEVIAVNQAGRPAHPVSIDTEQQVWYANNGDGTYTVGLFNLGSSAATVTVNWSDIGLTGPASVRDLWSHSDLGTFDTGYSSVNLASHGSRLFKVTSQGGTASLNDDDTGVKYTGSWKRNDGMELTEAKQNLLISVKDASAENSTISPTTGSFDKEVSAQADVTTTMTLNGNELSSIANGGTILTLGTDYMVSGDEVTIKKEYLANRPVGITHLTFSFSAGATQTLDITVSDTTIRDSDVTPAAISFDQKATAQADVTTTMTLNGNELSGISHGETTLVPGTDYTVSGNSVTVKKEYLAALPLGTTNLSFSFDAGAAQTVALIVKDSSKGGSISLNDDDASIVYTGAWNHSTNRGLGDYKNDVHWTETNNDYFEYEFTGTGIEMITEMDPSQGEMDIYVDNEFKQTVSTYNLGRLAQQTVYNITGLPSGAHTLKVVKKSSGFFMLLDKLTVTVPDLISPSTASFDKAATQQADVLTTIIDGNNLNGIANGGTNLTSGTDYTVSGDEVTIKKEYLSAEPIGTTNLTFSFSGGATQILAITVSNTGQQNSTASINDSDPGITYSGPWGHSTGRGLGDYQDDVHYTEANDAYFEYSFTGTGIDFITERDSSQGDVDIYLDNEFKQTVSTYNDSRSVQQTVYSISGLSNDLHTFKAVKKSGSYMLLDKLSVSVNVGISPATGSFDKKATAQADVSTTMTLNGDTLSSISQSGTPLVLNTDYSVSGTEVTIKKEYLATRPVGTTNLTFTFGSGVVQTLVITVSDSTPLNSTITPSVLSFDQKASAQADISTTIAFNGNELSGIANGETALALGTDFTVSGNQVSIKKEYLATLQTGTTNLNFSFSEGATQNLAVIVSDTSRGRYVIVNDDDTEISYHGAWQHNRNRGLGDYKDDVHFTEADNDYYEFTFKGTGIEIVTEKDSSQGDMDIYVDNEFKQTISTYNVSKQALQTVYNITGLSDSEHTVKVVKKSGYYMLLDQLKYKIADLISPDTASFDRNAQADVTTSLNIDGSNLAGITNGETTLVLGSDYTLTGNQVTIKKEYLATRPVGTSALTFSFRGDYQNDVHSTETNNDYFEYTFKGTGIEFITAKGPSQGNIDIYVDNKFKQTVNTYHTDRLTGQTVYGISGLTNGTHTIKVVKKSGDYMLVDQLRFTVPSTILINDTDSKIKYKGTWSHSIGRGLGDYQDDVHITEKNNDYYKFNFKGTGVELITEMDASQGNIDIYVDDEFKQTVSTYHPTRLIGQTVYQISGLSKGTHTIKVVKKSGEYMLLDSIRVTS
ncbi:X2-like carbohydrate binding domain-containing protein [Cohnella luojiensis]|uniref:X2-like carbohydrate binding domain-containing protein n=1 Tax=Cohnella luojiensis TaxID=652876 RepID=UPI001F0E6846|nr:X2-like carbohydrate binding domain-containing protein [Cohnella luojiensis]